MRTTLRIGTRRSRLALWQANWVKGRLERQWPQLDVALVPIVTSGDKIRDRALSQVGGKGLFVKEIEDALLDGRADLAVHSVKDLPAVFPDGLVLSAVPQREDARDVLISRGGKTLDDVPGGARVGTSSLRRQALLLHLRPDLRVETLRGNVDTRLRKHREGVVDATVLAAAGLKRLGLMPAQAHVLSEERFLPAIGQGAIGIETRDGTDVAEFVQPLHDRQSGLEVAAERAFLRAVGGDCRTPLAAKASVRPDGVHLDALIASPDGRIVLRGQETGPADDAVGPGARLAARLLSQGGREILERLERERTGA